jgi:hypothetical protein
MVYAIGAGGGWQSIAIFDPAHHLAHHPLRPFAA